jgi:hypothetical protein
MDISDFTHKIAASVSFIAGGLAGIQLQQINEIASLISICLGIAVGVTTLHYNFKRARALENKSNYCKKSDLED